MRDIRRPPKQPAQRANSKTPPSHSKPPSQKIVQLQYTASALAVHYFCFGKAEAKVIKRARQQRHSRHHPIPTYTEGQTEI